MQKESGASRWCLWVMVWFYDDGKDIIEICRVAAYLNKALQPIAARWAAPAELLLATQRSKNEMSNYYREFRLIGCGAILALFFLLSGCASVPAEQRIDNIPMYGQPKISRPDALIKADEDFIKQAASGFGGSREVASKAWSAEADKFMSERNIDYAMRRYNQSWLLNPNNYQPYWGFGRVMLERDKMDEAIENLEKAIKLCDDPYQKVGIISDTATAYSYRAANIPENMSEERDRYFNLANQRFVESTTLDPKYGNAWLRWSHSLYREGKYADAWEKLKIARSLGVNATEVYLKNISQKMPEPK